MKKIFYTILVLGIFVITLSSCATSSAFVENTKCTTQSEIKIKQNWFGKRTLSFDNYELTLKKNKKKSSLSGYTIIEWGHYDEKNYFTGELKRDGVKIYDAEIGSIKEEKVRWFLETYKKRTIETFITMGNKNPIAAINGLNDYNKDLLVDTESDISDFSVKIKPVKDTMQNGKKYTLWGRTLSGLNVFVNDEEYALVDLISQPNTISFNEDYSQELTQAQKDYTIGLILCTAEYYYTLYTKNESGKGIIIDVKPE